MNKLIAYPIVFASLIFISMSSFGQCSILGAEQWQEVQVRIIDVVDPPLQENTLGEWLATDLNGITSIEAISQEQLKAMKIQVASKKACILYIDLYNARNTNEGVYYCGAIE